MSARSVALSLALLLPGLGQAAAQDGPPLHRRYDFTRPAGRVALPDAVVEASGLTLTGDGTRLLVHGDERGVVVVLDPAEGGELGRFSVGPSPVENDLEGIASVGPRLFLVSSTGLLYEFREAPPGGSSPYRLTDTRLGRRCQVEGLDHDPVDDVLLLACKTVAPPGDHAVVHRVPMAPWEEAPAALTIDLEELRPFGVRPRLRPSAVAVDPDASTILLLAARDNLLVEIRRTGTVVSVVQLPRARHPQAEGLAVARDGTLYIVDEAADQGRAHLTWYTPLGTAEVGRSPEPGPVAGAEAGP